MALFPTYSPKTLEDALGKQAQAQTGNIKDQYGQARKRLVSQQAASGRLMSGVSDYPLGDLDTSEASDLSGVSSDLATKLGGVPTEDWLNQLNFKRNSNLATQIGRWNKPSTLEEVFQGIGQIGPSAALLAAMA